MPLSYYTKVVLPVRRNLQDVPYDCGPASLKIILETLGIHLSEKELMRMCGTNFEDGTSPSEMVTALKNLHIQHEVIHPGSLNILESKVRELNLCLVDYQAWGDGGGQYMGLGTGHYSVVFGFNQTHIWLADPAKHHTEKQQKWGARCVRKDIFLKHWSDKEGNGRIVKRWMVAVPLVQPILTPFNF